MVYLSVTISYPSTQFEELYGPFVNLGPHLPQKDNSPKKKTMKKTNNKISFIHSLFLQLPRNQTEQKGIKN